MWDSKLKVIHIIFVFSMFLAEYFKEGEFWRILLPGIYTMEVFAEGFAPREVQFAIVEQNPTMLNVTLYEVIIHLTDLYLK